MLTGNFDRPQHGIFICYSTVTCKLVKYLRNVIRWDTQNDKESVHSFNITLCISEFCQIFSSTYFSLSYPGNALSLPLFAFVQQLPNCIMMSKLTVLAGLSDPWKPVLSTAFWATSGHINFYAEGGQTTARGQKGACQGFSFFENCII